jgi:hypothetical protein
MSEVTNQPPQKSPPQTRIPVNKIWLREQIDLPGGNSIIEVIDCAPPKTEGRQFFVAHFVPAHQVIELEWYKNASTAPYRTRLSLAFVRRFD